ncbi:unnamed protein product [Urochloa decumbens]|uniref:Uncharacterized protein n=1 Tax=Urochloa decumbens TaxID=240449 RepID=A0ABC9BEY8_9POAL
MNVLQLHLHSHLEQLQAQQKQWMSNAEEYMLKAGHLADRLGLNKDALGRDSRNAAWSATIPACQVFSRLRQAVPDGERAGRPTVDDIHRGIQQLGVAAQKGHAGHATGDEAQAMEVDVDLAPGCAMQELPRSTAGVQPQVADLFTTPEPPILPQLPQRRQRARRTFDMTAVLQQYVNAIGGPLPESVIAALTAFLDLDDNDAELTTEALIEHAGEGLEDLQQVEGAAVPSAA